MSTTIEEILETRDEESHYMLLEPREKFDPCAVGVVEGYGKEPRVCYSYEKVIAVLLEDGGTLEEVLEHFSFNVIGSYVGERTPCFLFQGV